MSALLPSLGGVLPVLETRHGLRARTALKLRAEDGRSGAGIVRASDLGYATPRINMAESEDTR
jgi:hypothetical protein